MLLHTFLLFYSLLSPDHLVVWMCRMLHWCKGGLQVCPCTSEVVVLESLSICLRLDKLKSSNLSVVFCSIPSKQRDNPKIVLAKWERDSSLERFNSEHASLSDRANAIRRRPVPAARGTGAPQWRSGCGPAPPGCDRGSCG